MSSLPSARKILVIDDQSAIHDAFRTVLEIERDATEMLDALEAALFGDSTAPDKTKEAFCLEFAFQGREGFEKTEQANVEGSPFALAFVDMRMPPGWDGLETIENLWRVAPDLQVVVCTAYSDHSWDNIGKRLGRSDQLLLLKKPFANEEVYQLAVALTEKWRLAKAVDAQLESLQVANEQLEKEIDQRRVVERRLLQLAHFDPLTNLPNRLALVERLEQLLDCSKSNSATVNALLFLDLDNFKFINDSLGHSEGDELLKQIGVRLRQDVEGTPAIISDKIVMASRLGGDEFVVLLENLESTDEAVSVAGRLNEVLNVPFLLAGHEIIVSCSIGIAIIDASIRTAEVALRNADTAMYSAKSDGKNRAAAFDESMHASIVARLELESRLRTAIKNQQFELHYQPIVELHSMQTTGFEALVRWRSEDGRLIPPNVFISLAEETGLIVPLGEWIFEEACRTLVQWNSSLELENHVSMSINVSKRQFTEESFCGFVADVLLRTKAPGHLVHIEITESLVMDNPKIIVHRIHELQSLGIQIYMDDFGTGHSSLSCLHQFPIDVLKIDQSFVSNMEQNKGIAVITDAITVMARKLEIKVVAEGIETARQLASLIEMGCDYGQGYYFSKPLPKPQISLPMHFIHMMSDPQTVDVD